MPPARAEEYRAAAQFRPKQTNFAKNRVSPDKKALFATSGRTHPPLPGNHGRSYLTVRKSPPWRL
jgi:hypothetical protein